MSIKIQEKKSRTKQQLVRGNALKLTLMVFPMMLVVLVVSYLPMGGMIVAFKNYNYSLGIWGSPFMDPIWKNFSYLFKSPDTYRMLTNTIVYNLAILFLTTILSVTIAMLLNEIRSRNALKVYQTAMFIPYFLSWVVVSFICYAYLSPRLGYINSLTTSLGGDAKNWYNLPKAWRIILVFFGIWKSLGMNVIMYYAALMSIDSTYYEAAALDGATKWQMMWRVTLPHLIPTIIILTILGIGGIFSSDIGLFYQLPMNSPTLYSVTDTLDTYIYRALMNNANLGMSSAASFFKSIVGFIMVVTTNTIVNRIDSDLALY